MPVLLAGRDMFRNLARETKAAVLVSEVKFGRAEPRALKQLLGAMCSSELEIQGVVRLVISELREASYSEEILRELEGWFLPRRGGPLPERKEEGEKTPAGVRLEAAAPELPAARVSARATPTKGSPRKADAKVGPKGRRVDTKDLPVVEATPLGKERSRPAAPPERSARPTPQDVPAFEMDSAWGFGAGKPGAKGAPPGAARRGGGTGRIALEGKRAVTGTDQFRFTEEDAGGGKPRVLIAEDDERIRMVYRIKLEAAGYRVREAGDGAEAWKLLQVERFDGLVLDMKMPGYHGLDVLNRMKAADIKIPVVICTAYDQLSEEFAVATHPNLKFLTKPVPPEAILKAFGDLIHGKKG